MEVKAELKQVTKDIRGGGFVLTFSTQYLNPAELESLDGDLRLKAVKWREKRSLDANAYMWALISAIAEVMDTSKDEVYEEMIQRYSKPHDEPIVITIRDHSNVNRIDGHWKFLKEQGNFKAFMLLKGSSEFDSYEMSRFIDRIKEEAADLGIETMTPEELERLNGYEKKRAD